MNGVLFAVLLPLLAVAAAEAAACTQVQYDGSTRVSQTYSSAGPAETAGLTVARSESLTADVYYSKKANEYSTFAGYRVSMYAASADGVGWSNRTLSCSGRMTAKRNPVTIPKAGSFAVQRLEVPLRSCQWMCASSNPGGQTFGCASLQSPELEPKCLGGVTGTAWNKIGNGCAVVATVIVSGQAANVLVQGKPPVVTTQVASCTITKPVATQVLDKATYASTIQINYGHQQKYYHKLPAFLTDRSNLDQTIRAQTSAAYWNRPAVATLCANNHCTVTPK